MTTSPHCGKMTLLEGMSANRHTITAWKVIVPYRADFVNEYFVQLRGICLVFLCIFRFSFAFVVIVHNYRTAYFGKDSRSNSTNKGNIHVPLLPVPPHPDGRRPCRQVPGKSAEGNQSFAVMYTFSQVIRCGNVTFLTSKKVTKEGGIGEALRKSMNYGIIATGNHLNF